MPPKLPSRARDGLERGTAQITRAAPYIVILGTLLLIIGWWVILGTQKEVQKRLSTEDGKLAHVEAKLSSIVRESSSTRVITVSSRCGLTEDFIVVLPELGATAARVAPFEASLAGCRKQLAEVERIAAR